MKKFKLVSCLVVLSLGGVGLAAVVQPHAVKQSSQPTVSSSIPDSTPPTTAPSTTPVAATPVTAQSTPDASIPTPTYSAPAPVSMPVSSPSLPTLPSEPVTAPVVSTPPPPDCSAYGQQYFQIEQQIAITQTHIANVPQEAASEGNYYGITSAGLQNLENQLYAQYNSQLQIEQNQLSALKIQYPACG